MADLEALRRWLRWAAQGNERIERESTGGKKQVLCALVWVGAIG